MPEREEPAYCPCCGAEGLLPLIWPEGKHIDVLTRIWPIHEWGFATTRGHVSDSTGPRAAQLSGRIGQLGTRGGAITRTL